MAIVKSRGMIGLFAASAMLFSSTGAVAASTPVASTQIDPWAVLSVMNGGASAIAACGAAASAATAAAATAAAATTAAQPTSGCVLPQVDVAPIPPAAAGVAAVPGAVPAVVPIAAAGAGLAGLGISPLLLGLAALAAGVGLYAAVKNSNKANSPA